MKNFVIIALSVILLVGCVSRQQDGVDEIVQEGRIGLVGICCLPDSLATADHWL